MKKFLTVSTAVAALMLGVSGAAAQDSSTMYITGEGESRMIMGGDNAEGVRLLRGESGAAPSDCPAGSFYEGGNNVIMACDGGASYDLSAPGEGMMMESGEAYPEGAMMMQNRVPDGTMDQNTGVEDTTGTDANSDSN